MSAGGRFVAFSSDATNLVAGDRNAAEDVFLRDRRLKRTIRVSVTSTGDEANGASYFPLISADGRLVFFRSVATTQVLVLQGGDDVEPVGEFGAAVDDTGERADDDGYFSFSYSAPHLFGDRVEDFASEVRELLALRSPEGIFWDWPGDTEVIFARKPD